jgi:hypothetical protein
MPLFFFNTIGLLFSVILIIHLSFTYCTPRFLSSRSWCTIYKIFFFFFPSPTPPSAITPSSIFTVTTYQLILPYTTTPRTKTPQHQQITTTMLLYIIFFALIVTTTAQPILSDDITSQATQTSVSEPTSPPTWLHSATISLICYDVIAVGAFIWLWVCRYLAWSKRIEGEREEREVQMVREMRRERRAREARTRTRGRHTLVESEMRRMGML